MTSNRIIRSITLCAVALLLLSACSIYDEYPARRHYDVILRIAMEQTRYFLVLLLP